MGNSIIFIGYRGTGKTTVARQLAAQLGLPAKDSDAEIERKAGKTIAEIFAQDGEALFREMEESVIAEILGADEPVILATGGGAILRSATRNRLRRSGTVIWLTAAPATILRRITDDAHSATMRPHLTSLPPLEEIVSILEKRTPLYAETAHETICTDAETVDEIVRRVIGLIPGN